MPVAVLSQPTRQARKILAGIAVQPRLYRAGKGFTVDNEAATVGKSDVMKRPNPLNPLDWLKTAQDWFSKTERSSGFRPYLIFLLLLMGFDIVLMACFPNSEITQEFVFPTLYISVLAFVLLYIVKAFQDPNFCRSEKHIETVKQIEMAEQKGDAGPVPIDVESAKVIANPESGKALEESTGGRQ
jgi:hypothetical protein